MSELVAAMKSLCRMCSSKGLIHINSVLEPSLLKMSRKVAEMWKVPILEMMTAIGGEEVTLNDGLPQYICTCCHFYLQHAYDVRLKIRESSFSLRTAVELQQQEGIDFTSAQDQVVALPEQNASNISRREIISEEEDLEEERKLYKLFQNADIKIQYPNNESYHETKCAPCNIRFMEEETYEKHKATCVMVHLDDLYRRLETLSNMRVANQIDREEFVLRALDAIHKTKDRTDNFCVENGLADISLCNSTPVFDADAATRNRIYHENQEKKRANKFNLTNNQQVTNQTINMHFTNTYPMYGRMSADHRFQRFD